MGIVRKMRYVSSRMSSDSSTGDGRAAGIADPGLGAEPAALREIVRDELARKLRDPRLTLLDVLSPESYRAAHIPGAINLPLESVSHFAGDLLPDRNAEIAVYCAKFT
jgi:Rhodanese-like domain